MLAFSATKLAVKPPMRRGRTWLSERVGRTSAPCRKAPIRSRIEMIAASKSSGVRNPPTVLPLSAVAFVNAMRCSTHQSRDLSLPSSALKKCPTFSARSSAVWPVNARSRAGRPSNILRLPDFGFGDDAFLERRGDRFAKRLEVGIPAEDRSPAADKLAESEIAAAQQSNINLGELGSSSVLERLKADCQ